MKPELFPMPSALLPLKGEMTLRWVREPDGRLYIILPTSLLLPLPKAIRFNPHFSAKVTITSSQHVGVTPKARASSNSIKKTF